MTWCRTEDHGILPFRIKVIFYLFSEWLRLKHVSDCAMADQVLSAKDMLPLEGCQEIARWRNKKAADWTRRKYMF